MNHGIFIALLMKMILGLIELIKEHYKNLVKELQANNSERISFEAAWLAHAIVDGLTPAHHYPYEAETKRDR